MRRVLPFSQEDSGDTHQQTLKDRSVLNPAGHRIENRPFGELSGFCPVTS